MPYINMAEVQHLSSTLPQTQPQPIPERSPALDIPAPASAVLSPGFSANRIRNSHLALDTFSPVNQNGSFEFDRVLKSGWVQKRTRKTKAWKPIFLVLRPNYLSIYKDANEDKLRHKIHLADLTAVAFLKDPKQKRRNVFGLFSPSRNYHLEATTKGDAEQWVDLIRKEARIEEEEEEMLLASPGGNITGTYAGFDQSMAHQQAQLLQDERVGSSSPEPADPILSRSSTQQNRQRLISPMGRRPSHTMDYSGNEFVSDADLSDTDLSRFPGASPTLDVKAPPPASSRAIMSTRNASQMSIPLEHDPERVIWQGYLLYLRSKNGIRQWKDVWVVLRPRTVSIYKNDSEYSPVMILPFESVINVVEIDPLSRTKTHCLQMIGEEKSYKFCAHGEDELDRCLGAFKSLLARRKEGKGGAVRA
ncbi:hypothetical protein ACMFMG_002088 [Clarireedia jacksonii]